MVQKTKDIYYQKYLLSRKILLTSGVHKNKSKFCVCVCVLVGHGTGKIGVRMFIRIYPDSIQTAQVTSDSRRICNGSVFLHLPMKLFLRFTPASLYRTCRGS